MRQLLCRAMQQPDDVVVEFDYCDRQGETTHRVVSPIRFLGSDRFLALCLSREEPRQFHLARCSNARSGRASEYVMPLPLVTS
jgi:predicted DNA-binding transcriptional regulator YafY